jgi:gliding motility-associated-like protein
MKNCKNNCRITVFSFVIFFYSISIYGQHINNGNLRFGSDGAISINSSGNLQQPWYYNEGDSRWWKLTYSNYALDSKIAVGGDGTAEWNENGTLRRNPIMNNQTIDQSNFTVNSGTGTGTLVVKGEITIGSNNFELEHSYTLLSEKFIKIETTLTNKGASSANNIRFWVGTKDDYIGNSDVPRKVRSNITNSSLVSITTISQRSKALEVSSNDEGVLFFTTYPNANTAIKRYSSITFPATTIDPNTVPILTEGGGTIGGPNDSSYALFIRMNDLAQNESDSFSWYYAASPISEFQDIIDDVFQDTPPTVELTDNDSDNILISDDSVLITATFSKAMAATPTVEIDGGVLTPTPMSATASPSVWEYTIDVNSLFSLEGTYSLSVNGSDTLGNAYTGTDSLTYSVDLTPPTVNLTDDDSDNILIIGDSVVVTATFSKAMAATPTVEIDGGILLPTPMTATASSSVWEYTIDVNSLFSSDGTYSLSVTGSDTSGISYTGTDSITYVVDVTSPTINLLENDADDVLIDGETVLLTASANETISGTPTLTITTSGGSNDYAMTSAGVSWTYSYSPPSSYSGVVTFTVEMIDVAGNTASTTISLNADTIIPTILSIRSPMANGTYTDYDGNNSLSDTVSITVNFSESVTVTTTNGSPRLLLNTTPATYAYYVDGSGTAALTFTSLVNEEAETDDLNISTLELNGGTILDASSNTASLTLTYVTSNSTNLSDNKDIVLDAKNPVLSNYTLSDNNNLAPIQTTSVNDGDIATYGFESDKELLMSSLTVTFTGFTTTVSKTVTGTGPFSYEISFTVSNTFPEGEVEIDISATDQVTTTVVPIGNPTGVFDEEFFTDRIIIDRTAPTITSSANLNSDENTTAGPTIIANEAAYFSIVGGADQALIAINPQFGTLTFSSAPDYEAPVDAGADNTYEIIVKAIDKVGLTVTQTVTIQINDLNDTFGVEVTQTDIQTTESGETASINFVLITQPSANVTFELSLSDTTEGSLSATQLTFTSENWNTEQTITISGVDDGLTDGDVTYQLITANTASDDTKYNGLVVDDVTLTNIDDEIDTDNDGFFDYEDDFPDDPNESLDTDGDGVGNNADTDDDGDGWSDAIEESEGTNPLDASDEPLDTDGDRVRNSQDPDDDNDGVLDSDDYFPLDPTETIDTDGDGIGNNVDADDDGDSYSDVVEINEGTDPLDSNSFPEDQDGDGISEQAELLLGTDPNNPDTDGDGVNDKQDAFPLDPENAFDTDNDGIADSQEDDIDNDGILNDEDAFPLDPNESRDNDRDGIGDNADPDDDNDGYSDSTELAEGSDPFDASITPVDNDRDGLSDAEELALGTDPNNFDTDNDGVNDKIDAFPLDPDNNSDQDRDGIPDLLDDDDDNDGVLDRTDVFPYDPFESEDTDSDGIGNNADEDDDNDGFSDLEEIEAGTDPKNKLAFPEDIDGDGLSNAEELLIGTDPENPDSDGDGVPDGEDAFPLNPLYSKDTDGDGLADAIDIDDDNDGVPDTQDAFPLDPNESEDNDRDGIGDNADLDDDNDGYSDLDEIVAGTNPKNPNESPLDSDNDGLSDFIEELNGTDPNNPDTDGDGVLDGQDAFPLNDQFSEDNDNDGIPDEVDIYGDNDSDALGDIPDIDDDNDGIVDVAENVFITFFQDHFISVNNTGGKKSSIEPKVNQMPRTDRGVGKWKIRKKIVGGADASKMKIVGGEPSSSEGQQKYFGGPSSKNDSSEGYLTFINIPDPNNPDDANRDGIYEVEIAYINTTPGDPQVPIPTTPQFIEATPNTLEVFELETVETPVSEVSADLIISDTDGDGIINSRDPDDDGDHIYSEFEGSFQNGLIEDITVENNAQDTDQDGFADFLDPDDDNDGVYTLFENPDPNLDFNPEDAIDSDLDQIPDYLDRDDDGDGIDTINEVPDQDGDGNSTDALDFDNDGTPDYLDIDDDNDGQLTRLELTNDTNTILKDTDNDGIPDYHDTDDDNDGVPSLIELNLDTDADGTLNPVDQDDDGDGILTLNEDLNQNGDPTDDDTDNDGIPNYLESSLLDQDEDGVVDQLDTVDDDPYNDQDGDGFPNLDETIAGTDPLDQNSFPQNFDNPALKASIDIVTFFSPNSDGINDTWQIKEIDRYFKSEVFVYTRSGYLVFQTKNYRNDWTGNNNGSPLPEGSYYYRIDLDGNNTIDFEGWLYLTR